MNYTLNNYVNESPARAVVREGLNNGSFNLEDVLLGTPLSEISEISDDQEKKGIDYKFCSDNGVRLYNWDERLSLIEATQNEQRDNENIGFAKSVISAYENGNLARKRKEAQEYIVEYEAGMYVIDSDDKKSQYNARRKKEKYNRSKIILEKANTVYANAKKLVEQVEYVKNEYKDEYTSDSAITTDTTTAREETDKPVVKPRTHHAKPLAYQKRKESYRNHLYSSVDPKYARESMPEFEHGTLFKYGKLQKPKKYDAGLYGVATAKGSIEDRLNRTLSHALTNNFLFKGISRVAERIDEFISPIDHGINTFLYGEPVHTPAPFELPAHEIAIHRLGEYVTKGLSSIKNILTKKTTAKNVYTRIFNLKKSVSLSKAA